MELIWLAVVALAVIVLILIVVVIRLLRHVIKLELICQALTDPDEWDNMLADLRAKREHHLYGQDR